jgi:type VI secretion system protein ImpA
MINGQVLDLEALLAPLSDAAPTGVDLRDDASPQSIYYRLKDLRSTARAAERRADSGEDTTGAQTEWRQILDLSQQALGRQAKDLEVACWLVEALVRTQGFAGLQDGFRLLKGLVEAYGDKLYAFADEDGAGIVIASFAGLNGVEGEGTLIQPIRKIPLTSGGDQPFAAYHYGQAEDLAKLTDNAAKERRIAAGVPTIEKFDEAMRTSPKDFLRALLSNLNGSLTALDELSTLLHQTCGANAPPSSRIKETIEGVYDLVRSRTRDLLPAEPEAAHMNGANGVAEEARPNGVSVGVSGAITNREEALRTLGKISEFFKATEPHSTIAFTLDDVIRRARLSLPELLAELLPDAAARRTFLTSAGIRPPDG